MKASLSIKPELIEVENLSISFGTNNVLKKMNLTLHENESIVVVGKSGSGKSVLIKCIIGLLEADSGKIKVFGKDISNLTENEFNSMKSDMGFLFQGNALYDSMTIRENMEFAMIRQQNLKSRKEMDALIMESLSDVGLSHTIDMMPAELSGGMRKRIAIARTIVMKPKIILYDEPTAGLDPITGREIIKLINSIKEKYHTASLIITHDINCIQLTGDLIIILHEGKAYTCDTYQNLKRSNDPVISSFLNINS
jgi:phospholipid/cholesterol/gamma-HCH transport system ATP-binding protein